MFIHIVERELEEDELVETDFTEEWSTPPAITAEYMPLNSGPRPCKYSA